MDPILIIAIITASSNISIAFIARTKIIKKTVNVKHHSSKNNIQYNDNGEIIYSHGQTNVDNDMDRKATGYFLILSFITFFIMISITVWFDKEYLWFIVGLLLTIFGSITGLHIIRQLFCVSAIICISTFAFLTGYNNIWFSIIFPILGLINFPFFNKSPFE